jgi:hypothetical protein
MVHRVIVLGGAPEIHFRGVATGAGLAADKSGCGTRPSNAPRHGRLPQKWKATPAETARAVAATDAATQTTDRRLVLALRAGTFSAGVKYAVSEGVLLCDSLFMALCRLF